MYRPTYKFERIALDEHLYNAEYVIQFSL